MGGLVQNLLILSNFPDYGIDYELVSMLSIFPEYGIYRFISETLSNQSPHYRDELVTLCSFLRMDDFIIIYINYGIYGSNTSCLR